MSHLVQDGLGLGPDVVQRFARLLGNLGENEGWDSCQMFILSVIQSRNVSIYLMDDIVNGIRVQRGALERVRRARRQAFIEDGHEALGGKSEVAGDPAFLQHVFEVISLFQHWISALQNRTQEININ